VCDAQWAGFHGAPVGGQMSRRDLTASSRAAANCASLFSSIGVLIFTGASTFCSMSDMYYSPQSIIKTSPSHDIINRRQSHTVSVHGTRVHGLCAIGCVCQQMTDGLNIDLFGSKNLGNSV